MNSMLRQSSLLFKNLRPCSRLASRDLRTSCVFLADKDEKKVSNQATKTPTKIRIYTKTGDKGFTSLFTGERRSKDDAVFEALGNTDELNSSIGLAREFCLEMSGTSELDQAGKDIESKLIKIQCILLDIGSFIATPKTRANEKQLERLSKFDTNLTKEVEKWIDTYETELPVLRNFILPSGGKLASSLHLSRSICRRAERSLQPLLRQNDLDSDVVVFVNRLSDFLFVCARYAAKKQGKEEVAYRKS